MLEMQLSYTFKRSLLLQALTHRSKHSKNYERLEFRCSVLSLCISEHLFKQLASKGPSICDPLNLISKAN